VPREDYRLLRHRMLDPAAMGWKFSANWLATHQQEIGEIIARIRQHGPVRAALCARRKGQRLVGLEAGEAPPGGAVYRGPADGARAAQFPAGL
jgi:hypothetical protein